MLAEAKQPRSKVEMRERLTELLSQVRREAKMFTVSREQWQAECELRNVSARSARGAHPPSRERQGALLNILIRVDER